MSYRINSGAVQAVSSVSSRGNTNGLNWQRFITNSSLKQ